MNDFTKRELGIIIKNMSHLRLTRGAENVLINKIKSMIDNYCEHKEFVMDCDGGISLACKNCNKILLEA